jgi:hypothetical protein
VSGFMELPTLSKTVGRAALCCAGMTNRVVCMYFEGCDAGLVKVLRFMVMAGLGVAVWWW